MRSTYFGAATPILPFTSSISISVSELCRLAGESLFPCLLALQCKARLPAYVLYYRRCRMRKLGGGGDRFGDDLQLQVGCAYLPRAPPNIYQLIHHTYQQKLEVYACKSSRGWKEGDRLAAPISGG